MSRNLLRAALAVAALVPAPAVSAQTPQAMAGEWSTTATPGGGADSSYDLHMMLSGDLLTYTISGGPSDHQKGITCAYGYGATYTVTARQGSSIRIRQNVDSLKGRIHKPSQLCYQHYQSAGIVLPQEITLELSPDASVLTVNDRVKFTRMPKRSPKIWSAFEINAFVDYYRGLMKIY